MKFAAALQRTTLAYVVDDQTAHRACCVRKEARPIWKTGVARGDVKVGLVQQCGCSEGRTERVAVQLVLSHPMQFRIQRRKELLGGTQITAVRGTNRAGYPCTEFGIR